MSLSTFDTPSPVAVVLDLYVADVRLTASDRADTVVEVRASDPGRAADVKAAESTRVEFDRASGTVSVVCRKPLNRFVNFGGRRPESVEVVIGLPTGSAVRGEAAMGDLQGDGVLGSVVWKADLGTVRLEETGPLDLRGGVGGITVGVVTGAARVRSGSSDIRIGTVDGTAEVSTGNGHVQVGAVTGAAGVRNSNGSVRVDRALSDITAATSNGAVYIGEVTRGKVSATSKNGGVEVGVREGSAAWLELNTGVGCLYNDLDTTDAPEADEPLDKVEIHADTKLGDITIRRALRLTGQD